MSHQMDQQLRNCIQNCSDCHNICLETANHCLMMGGKHAEAKHIRTLMDCADICRTSSGFMLRTSEFHHEVCGLCADLCEACAKSCEQIGADDETMRRCAEMCRRCAQSCREMAGMSPQRRAA